MSTLRACLNTDPAQPHLLVLDVDSTLIRNEVIDLLAAHAGAGEQVAAVTARAMRGELDFAESLRARVATLEGLPQHVLEQTLEEITVTEGVPELISTLHAQHWRIGVVSGGFSEIVQPLAQRLGIDYARANRLEMIDGYLTGALLGPIIDRPAKAEALIQWAAASNIPLTHTVAIGDGANDLDMLAVAGLGIAFMAKEALRVAADVVLEGPSLAAVLDVLGQPSRR